MYPFKNRPDFFVVGAQKAGTTRLCHLLDRHPDVVIPTKEPFYFQSPDAMQEKADWYQALFESAPPALTYGEGSTYYSMCDTYPGTAERIARFNPQARIVYMVRHPFRRIESAWYQLLSTREMSGLRSFKEAVRGSDVLIEPSLYWRQLSVYREFFPDDQIHIVVFEEFVLDELATIAACLRFLGVRDACITDTHPGVELNASSSKRQPWLVVDLAKAMPGYRRIKLLVPEVVRIALGDLLLKPIRAIPDWDSQLLDYVRSRVESDCHSLLDHISRPRSTWDLHEVGIRKGSVDSVQSTALDGA